MVDYLTNHPQYVTTCDCVSDRVVCSVGAIQGMEDFKHNSPDSHLLKFNNSAIFCGVGSHRGQCNSRLEVVEGSSVSALQ